MSKENEGRCQRPVLIWASATRLDTPGLTFHGAHLDSDCRMDAPESHMYQAHMRGQALSARGSLALTSPQRVFLGCGSPRVHQCASVTQPKGCRWGINTQAVATALLLTHSITLPPGTGQSHLSSLF